MFTVDKFLTTTECLKFIQYSEDCSYEDALVSTPQGHVHRPDVRTNQRVMFRSDEFATMLWERAIDFVPTEFDGRSAVGVNEMLRFYRYDAGQRFNWHQDFPYERDNGERSYLTFMIYLNDDFRGGETSFEDSYSEESFEPFSVVPKQGMALFFEHGTYHTGELVLDGRKYVLRTDVMYSSDESDDGHPCDDREYEEDW